MLRIGSLQCFTTATSAARAGMLKSVAELLAWDVSESTLQNAAMHITMHSPGYSTDAVCTHIQVVEEVLKQCIANTSAEHSWGPESFCSFTLESKWYVLAQDRLDNEFQPAGTQPET